MVVKHGQDCVSEENLVQVTPSDRGNANLATSGFIPQGTRMTVETQRPEFLNLRNSVIARKPEFGFPTDFSDHGALLTNTTVPPTYANISAANENANMTDRQTIVMRRPKFIELADGHNSPRNSMKYQSEYESMSSPECSSNSSSARSSNTGSFYGNISPDTLSLASFAGRLNFGRFGGSKRSSQSSNASSQDSRQSWGKSRDSFDLSDAVGQYYVRRDSKEQVYENTRPFTPESCMKFSSKIHDNSMDGMIDHDETPPPLPIRQNLPLSCPSDGPELILPYKVVDLEELQRSLEDIEPYYISHTRDTDDADSDSCNECSDHVEKDVESDPELTEGDFRPVLPPKKKHLEHSQSDSCCNSVNAAELVKERPTPLPRQSFALSEQFQANDGTVQSTDENINSAERLTSTGCHEARPKSLQSAQASRTRGKSPSPPKTARPMRSAPPVPPPRSWSTGVQSSSSRPVSEMFPRSQAVSVAPSCSPVPLKRSMTVSALQSPFSRRPVQSLCEERSENAVLISIHSPTTIHETDDEKTKAVTTKSVAFFGKSKLKKALSTLKIPGTRKTAKRELAISPPSDFASLYQGKFTADYSNCERTSVSVLPTDDNCAEDNSDVSRGISEPATELAEVTTEDDEEPLEQLSFHPEFTGIPIGDELGEQLGEQLGDQQLDDHCYYNLPNSPTLLEDPEKSLPDDTEKTCPKKPPRSGYLQPSLSQRTIEREEEISLNKVPELGPLPTPPESSSAPITPDGSPTLTPNSDAPSNNDSSAVATPESHEQCNATTEADGKKLNNEKAGKPLKKPKPEVPCRPKSLKLKPKISSKPVVQPNDKPKPIPRSLTLDSATIQKSLDSALNCKKERRRSTPLEESAGLSRSCDFLDIDDPRDNYLTDMHVIVLKDILRCWRTSLRKPTISLAGACWEDFEMVEDVPSPKVSDYQGCVSVPVRLRKASTSLDSSNGSRQYIAKIKCKTEDNSKSLFDQDYSVCSSVDPHENVSRVLAYFRGEIRSAILGEGQGNPLHTTISISDQVPSQTCAEFVAQSKDAHSQDPYSYERTVCMLVLQCLKGVMHLHDSGFTHGNLSMNNLFLIKHDHDYQLLIGNFGMSQALAKERRASSLHTKYDDDISRQSSFDNDFTAISRIITAMLHQDQNGNGTHASNAGYSALAEHLRKASERLRDGSATAHQVVRFFQALLWGPFRLGENIVIVSESRMTQWLDRQRGEFLARLAMDEALARTAGVSPRKFSVEDLLLGEYLTMATPGSLVRTEKRWFLAA